MIILFFSVEEKRDIEMSSELNSSDETDTESGSSRAHNKHVIVTPRRPSLLAALGHQHYGSFYLRMGAVG